MLNSYIFWQIFTFYACFWSRGSILSSVLFSIFWGTAHFIHFDQGVTIFRDIQECLRFEIYRKFPSLQISRDSWIFGAKTVLEISKPRVCADPKFLGLRIFFRRRLFNFQFDFDFDFELTSTSSSHIYILQSLHPKLNKAQFRTMQHDFQFHTVDRIPTNQLSFKRRSGSISALEILLRAKNLRIANLIEAILDDSDDDDSDNSERRRRRRSERRPRGNWSDLPSDDRWRRCAKMHLNP